MQILSIIKIYGGLFVREDRSNRQRSGRHDVGVSVAFVEHLCRQPLAHLAFVAGMNVETVAKVAANHHSGVSDFALQDALAVAEPGPRGA